MSRELLKCSILISIILTGCSTVPKEDNSSVLMEDVIVERTTVRSTTQNPKPKSNGGVYISGDNITVGTIIVNSPGAKVDNSTNTINQTNQQNVSVGSSSSATYGPQGTSALMKNDEPAYHTDRDFFKGMDGVAKKLLPTFIMSTVVR